MRHIVYFLLDIGYEDGYILYIRVGSYSVTH
jgi:hypothetical protein